MFPRFRQAAPAAYGIQRPGIGLREQGWEPLDVQMGLGVESLDREGRIIPLESQAFYMINAYVPNAQDSPERRAYRTKWNGECSRFTF